MEHHQGKGKKGPLPDARPGKVRRVSQNLPPSEAPKVAVPEVPPAELADQAAMPQAAPAHEAGGHLGKVALAVLNRQDLNVSGPMFSLTNPTPDV